MEADKIEARFRRETDPTKLGKALSDQNTREVIIGVLLMLMVLPLLSPTEIDYSQEYGLRELFWMGRSNCISKEEERMDRSEFNNMLDSIALDHSLLKLIETDADEADDFYCGDGTQQSWVTTEGWMYLLRMYASAASVPEGSTPSWELLWLYIPDYTRNGRMGEIKSIPWPDDYEREDDDPEFFWTQNDACAGFYVTNECQWRFEEMALITYSPYTCTGVLEGCEELIAYARVVLSNETKQTAGF